MSQILRDPERQHVAETKYARDNCVATSLGLARIKEESKSRP